MIDPRYLSAREWCDATALQLSSYGLIPTLGEESEWPLWAEIVIQIPAIASYDPPGPRGFSNWVDWAERFNEAVSL